MIWFFLGVFSKDMVVFATVSFMIDFDILISYLKELMNRLSSGLRQIASKRRFANEMRTRREFSTSTLAAHESEVSPHLCCRVKEFHVPSLLQTFTSSHYCLLQSALVPLTTGPSASPGDAALTKNKTKRGNFSISICS